MMDREYTEDVDTMTEETDEALNPDYDRVSGSGEMPSLEEFLGVNHSSDGLGASSDPFGNVIGGSVFAEDGITDDDNDNVDVDTEEEPEQDENIKYSFKSMMDGSLLRIFLKRNIWLLVVLGIFAVLHIANRNHAESLIRQEVHLRSDVHNLRATSIEIAAKLMEISKVSEVSQLVEKRNLNIRKAKIPPMQFVIDKFERADSLIKDMPAYQQGALYDDGYEMYSR